MLDHQPPPLSPPSSFNQPANYLMSTLYQQRLKEDKKRFKERNAAIKDSIANAYLQCETSLSPFISHCLASKIGLVENPNDLTKTKSSKSVFTAKNKKKQQHQSFYNEPQQYALTPSASEISKSKSPIRLDFTQNKSALFIQDKLERMKNLRGGVGILELSLCDITPKANLPQDFDDQQQLSKSKSPQHAHFQTNKITKERSHFIPRRNVIVNCNNINLSNINNALFYDEDQKKSPDCKQLICRLRTNKLNIKTPQNDDKTNIIRDNSNSNNNSVQLKRSETFNETFYNSCQFIKQTQEQQQGLQSSKNKNIQNDSAVKKLQETESISLPRMYSENNNNSQFKIQQFLCSSSAGQEEEYCYPLYINRVNRVRGTQNYKGKRVKSCNTNIRVPRKIVMNDEGWDQNGNEEMKEQENQGSNKKQNQWQKEIMVDPRQIYRENLQNQVILPYASTSPKKNNIQNSSQIEQISENIGKVSANKMFLVNAVTNQLSFHV